MRLAKTPAILRTNGTRIAVAERGGLALKPRILIYDKDQAITRQLFWTLCDTYDVVTANDLPTALRRAAAYEPAVAVLDLSVPAIPGYEAVGLRILQYLKVHFPKSRILGMTIEILPETKRTYFSLGVDGPHPDMNRSMAWRELDGITQKIPDDLLKTFSIA